MQRTTQKCRLCECPAVDGGVSVSQMDVEEVLNWCLIILDGIPLDGIDENDVICCFCVWDARFLLSQLEVDDYGQYDQNFSLWLVPEVLENLNSNMKTLQYHYLAGDVQQCWLNLGKAVEDDAEELQDVTNTDQRQLNTFKCEHCPKTYKFSRGLARHRKKAHSNEFPSRSNDTASIQSKIVVDADQPKRYTCPYCKKSYTQHVYLQKHIHTQHPGKAKKCNFYSCPLYFQTSIEMECHIGLVHKQTPNVVCPYCRRKLDSIGIRGHVQSHHPEQMLMFSEFADTSVKYLICIYCRKQYKGVQSLEVHIRSLHSEISLKCKVPGCGKYFICKNEIKLHQKLDHTEGATESETCATEKEANVKVGTVFKCPMCPKTFSRKAFCNQHVASNHVKKVDANAFEQQGRLKSRKSRKKTKCTSCSDC